MNELPIGTKIRFKVDYDPFDCLTQIGTVGAAREDVDIPVDFPDGTFTDLAEFDAIDWEVVSED